MVGAAALILRHQTPRALFHRAAHQGFLLLHLLRRGRMIVVAHHHPVNLRSRYMRNDIDRHTLFANTVEILGERGPVVSDSIGLLRDQSVAWSYRLALAKHIQ